jgi:hypothetical protein
MQIGFFMPNTRIDFISVSVNAWMQAAFVRQSRSYALALITFFQREFLSAQPSSMPCAVVT